MATHVDPRQGALPSCGSKIIDVQQDKEKCMRILLIAAMAAASIALPAAAQNSGQSASPNGQNTPGQQAGGCGNQAAWTDQMSQKLAQNGYTAAQQMPQALVLHAIGPDGNPVVMVIAPVGQQ